MVGNLFTTMQMVGGGSGKEVEAVEAARGGRRRSDGDYMREFGMDGVVEKNSCYEEVGNGVDGDGWRGTLLRVSSSYYSAASAREQGYGYERGNGECVENSALIRVGAASDGNLVVAPRRRFISAAEIGALVVCLYGSALMVSLAVKLVIPPALVGICAMRLSHVVRRVMREMRRRDSEREMSTLLEKEKAEEVEEAMRARERIARARIEERHSEERALEMHRQHYAENLLEAALQLLQKDRIATSMHIDTRRESRPSLCSIDCTTSSSSTFQASSPHQRHSAPMFRTAAEAAASTSTKNLSARTSPSPTTLSFPCAQQQQQQQQQHGAFGHDIFFPRVASHSSFPRAVIARDLTLRVNNHLTLVR